MPRQEQSLISGLSKASDLDPSSWHSQQLGESAAAPPSPSCLIELGGYDDKVNVGDVTMDWPTAENVVDEEASQPSASAVMRRLPTHRRRPVSGEAAGGFVVVSSSSSSCSEIRRCILPNDKFSCTGQKKQVILHSPQHASSLKKGVGCIESRTRKAFQLFVTTLIRVRVWSIKELIKI